MLQQGLDVWIDVICEFKLHHVKVFLQQWQPPVWLIQTAVIRE